MPRHRPQKDTRPGAVARLLHLCRLSIEDKIPDHSVFSRARHERFRESEVFRGVFERVVASCIAVGLVGGEAFSIDASLIKSVSYRGASPRLLVRACCAYRPRSRWLEVDL
jgi:hypothetical protein